MSVFKKASRKQSKLRLALIGVSGSGKTWTALSIAKALGKRIAVIDSEHGSASLYAGDAAEFDVLNLETFAPRTYVEAIHAAEREGYDVIVIDSLSHAWMGKGGALEMVDNAAKRSQSRNTYTAWRDVTPEHNALVDAMVQCRAHIIVTMRSKTEYVLETKDRGKQTPTKVGMAPIQRDGLEYEFTVVGDMDLQHNLLVSKSRCSALDGAVISRPGKDVAETLLRWLNEGEQAPQREERREATPQRERPFERDASKTTETVQTITRPSGATASTGTQATGKHDEYGLTIPTSKCPVVQSDGPHHGKPWSELPGGLLEKMAEKSGNTWSAVQVEWCSYLLARRQARKAREAQQEKSA